MPAGPALGGRVFDVAAVEHVLTGRTLYARALIAVAVTHGNVIVVPATALAVAGSRIDPALRRRGVDLLVGTAVVVVERFDEPAARACADLLAAARPPSADVAAAHVAMSARRRGWPVVTDRPDTLLALDPTLEIEPLP